MKTHKKQTEHNKKLIFLLVTIVNISIKRDDDIVFMGQYNVN